MRFNTKLTSEIIPCGRISQKSVFIHICSFDMSSYFFHNGTGDDFGFTPLEKNAEIFARDTRAKYFFKGSRKSNQSSKHQKSQKVVMKVRFFTLL